MIFRPATLVRPALALLASLLLGAAIRPIVLIVVGATGTEKAAAGAIVANLLGVPLVAGVTLGFIARRRLFVLSVLYVIISLFGTFLSLGAAGLPHGTKILVYGLQLALLYGAARWGAQIARQSPPAALTPSS